ncbi:MAG TPA: HAD family hydrolase [Streptosporangiaceae bacterium]|jgi:hydroxymethylpyrimidine pyrophosphatase-like HAD family hydrolase|nr:HAD family hydrolase [Streptosporangiaceae bacterium]
MADTPAGLILVSFDIDGTLEAGDPPGPVTFAVVARAQARGYVIGSASDRTLSEQRSIWRQAGLTVDFTCHKHRLLESTAHFGAQRMLHIGDTSLDEYYARLAGFDFRYADQLSGPPESWLTF